MTLFNIEQYSDEVIKVVISILYPKLFNKKGAKSK